MQGLGLVAARRRRHPFEQFAAIQAHAALRVAHALAADQRQQHARDAVGEAADERHRGRVAEPVADHELRLPRRRRELWDELGRVLPVGVEDDDRVGSLVRAQHGVDPGGNGVALAGVVLDPHDAGRPRSPRDPVELRVQARWTAVGDDHQLVDVRQRSGDHALEADRVVAGNHRGEARERRAGGGGGRRGGGSPRRSG